MKRRLFNVASLLSMLLFVATVVLWLRSYDFANSQLYADSYRDGIHGQSIEIGSSRGEIEFEKWEPIEFEGFYSRPSWHGFGYQNLQNHVLWVVVPHWFVAAVMLVLPCMWVWKRVRNVRLPGHCPKCRYDLRGNISGVCPECGTAVAGT